MSGHARGGVPATSLDEVDRIFVDGNNLLHRTAGTVAGAAPRLLLARMTAGIPATIDTILILDGQPDPGSPARMRIRRGLEVRYSGRVDADGVLVYLVESQPFVDRARTIVVSDDRGLVERVRSAGGHTRRLDWFERLLDSPRAAARSGPGVGNAPSARTRGDARPDPRTSRHGSPRDPDDDGPRWQPGRGATRKSGNPRRGRPG